MKIDFRTFALVATATALSACASGPQKVEFPSDTNPAAKISELRDRMKADQAKQYDKLSPDNFEQAGKSLARAQTEIEQGKSQKDILSDAGEAAARLQIVEDNGAKNATLLQPVLAARQSAIDAHAPQLMHDDFATADKKFNEFGSDIEGGSFKPATADISKLESQYSDVELNAVKKANLGEAKTLIDRAEKRDAQSKAPQTLSVAKLRYASALRTIEANRRNPAGYQTAVADSTQSARKLDAVLNTIGDSQTTEAAAVKIYDQQQQLAATQQQLNQTEAQAAAQAQADQAKAQALQAQAAADAQAAQAKLSSEQQTADALKSQNDKYADKAAANQKIETVRQEFSPEEADVLRDGNKIILRLKTMKFSTARYELTQSSLVTLQKVKDMIAAVPVSKVVVEGHTDNVGTESKNMSLSQNRAETVKKYLVAENSVPEDKIEAKGFGYEKPLTSNKTAAGRATNRRVDIIIDTDGSLQ